MMRFFYMPTADSPGLDWLVFILFLLLLSLALGGFIVWLKVGHGKRNKRKRRKHRHHRSLNPTLAQTGGLPPKRGPNEPPPGP